LNVTACNFKIAGRPSIFTTIFLGESLREKVPPRGFNRSLSVMEKAGYLTRAQEGIIKI
jgi:hypothetical protein